MSKKNIVIIGAGPAGLTTAYSLLKMAPSVNVTIVEEELQVGGISKTIKYDNNCMDLGGHRFFSKSSEVNNIWKELLPIQAKPSFDDIKTSTTKDLPKNGPDPEKEDNVFLIRNRVSRIYYNKKFFDYPISLKFKVFKNLGVRTTIASGFSYLKSIFVKKEETNLENFYINRFGKKLYNIFFEGYTEKLWGRKPSEIDASWGRQRVKGLSIKEVLKNYFNKNKDASTKETSLIESFYYPKYGPGQMWEVMAKEIEKMGGKILFGYKVNKVIKKKNKISYIVCSNKNEDIKLIGDIYVSSMPIKDLILSMNSVNQRIKSLAYGLPYRDFMTVGLILKSINLRNNTKIKTLNNIIPDCWIYVQGKQQKLGRIQVFNNWSPYLVNDINTISLGLEYFCLENDEYWNMTDEAFMNMAVEELIGMNIINNKDDVIKYNVERVKKAYPAYFDTYKNFDEIKSFLINIDNLYCIGRNGQHRYNNMDHSMETGILTSHAILGKKVSKEDIWNVNTEESYHEEKNNEKTIK